jgi:hypothetical protein
MKLIFVAPLVAIVLAGAGVGAYFAVAGAGSGEEAASVEATPTPQPTPTPAPTETPASDDWTTYQDTEVGFSFPLPQGLTVTEDSFDLFGKQGDPSARMRVRTFRDASGVRVIDLGSVPNPTGLSVQDWMDTYDPCPSAFDLSLPQPESITIAGEAGVLCPIDQLNQPNPRVYFQHGGYVFVLVANVYGIPESGFPPALSEADFQRVIDGFSFGP